MRTMHGTRCWHAEMLFLPCFRVPIAPTMPLAPPASRQHTSRSCWLACPSSEKGGARYAHQTKPPLLNAPRPTSPLWCASSPSALAQISMSSGKPSVQALRGIRTERYQPIPEPRVLPVARTLDRPGPPRRLRVVDVRLRRGGRCDTIHLHATACLAASELARDHQADHDEQDEDADADRAVE